MEVTDTHYIYNSVRSCAVPFHWNTHQAGLSWPSVFKCAVFAFLKFNAYTAIASLVRHDYHSHQCFS